MEMTTDFVHENYEMVKPPRREELSIKDYDNRDFLISSEAASPAMSAFMSNRYSEYRTLAFPSWKRLKLAGMKLPEISPRRSLSCSDPYVRSLISMNSDDVELLDRLDFEGLDRKILLQGDIFFSEGSMISIPPNKSLDNPYSVAFNRDSRILNNMFVLGENSSLKVVVDSKRLGNWLLQNNRFLIKEGASLELLILNRMIERGHGFINNLYLLEKNARLRVFEINCGNTSTASFHMALLEGEKALASLEPLFVARGDTVLDMQYVVRHRAIESDGRISGSGVLLDNGRSVFRGTIDIKRGAKGAKGSEHSNVLMLSESARADTIPSLLVGENQVDASHAATVGSVDGQKLFYLMSRGLTRDQSMSIIVRGAFEPTLREIDEIFRTTRRW
ncbi:MAG TPA: SufD family Fe-S cluster assembly protein [Mesotoga infera]|uniref:SufD family Fe-S cluster assembly protein n=1 Tax=Mesotoga infera TaxID=1236046 RepID=A0A7C1GS90_9BACT|nr:SufD family Fe-S cluster assembly protein [Mesotoga infera]